MLQLVLEVVGRVNVKVLAELRVWPPQKHRLWLAHVSCPRLKVANSSSTSRMEPSSHEIVTAMIHIRQEDDVCLWIVMAHLRW